MAKKQPKNPTQAVIPKGPRIDADADPRNGMWLQRAPLFPFRASTNPQPAQQPKRPKRAPR